MNPMKNNKEVDEIGVKTYSIGSFSLSFGYDTMIHRLLGAKVRLYFNLNTTNERKNVIHKFYVEINRYTKSI